MISGLFKIAIATTEALLRVIRTAAVFVASFESTFKNTAIPEKSIKRVTTLAFTTAVERKVLYQSKVQEGYKANILRFWNCGVSRIDLSPIRYGVYLIVLVRLNPSLIAKVGKRSSPTDTSKG